MNRNEAVFYASSDQRRLALFGFSLMPFAEFACYG
jgi:hypothetical protein